MRTLAFDGRTGASGDMILGALLAAGADPDTLAPVEAELGVRYEVTERCRSGITATAVDVLRQDGSDDRRSDRSQEGDGNSRNHDEGRDDAYEHTHDRADHAEGSGPTRTYPEVVEIVEGMALPEGVESRARATFGLLGEAEASVHGTALAETHFHEVGADDAIADIVGASLLIADIDPDRIVTTPLATGGGEVETSHGVYPVPVPAVVEIAERADWSLRGGPAETELLTPTGAAILAHVADGVDALPSLELEAAGYGAGSKALEGRPNVLRAVVGTTAGGLRRDPITVLETNLDDATPEVLGGLQKTLADAGALDVSVLPATMKKSRPGHLVKVIVKPEDAERVARRLAEETGTLGVREHGAGHRFVAGRRVETATVESGGTQYDVDVKVATDESGAVYDVSAEFDDAQAVAAETGEAVRTILRRAEAQIRESENSESE